MGEFSQHADSGIRPSDEVEGVPPVEATLIRVVILMRLLGWAWLVVLVATTAMSDREVDRGVLWGAVALATIGTGLMLLAVRNDFLGRYWYAALDGAIAMALLTAGWWAGAGDFVAGGYPASWLFLMAFVTNLRWTFAASILAGLYFAFLHLVMGLNPVRTAGSIQYLVFALVAGWAFDALRERERLRLVAESDRREAEAELAVQRDAAMRLQERGRIARQLHDSVLQTLKLISSFAEDPAEVRYLTRVQERDLRRTINEYRSPYEHSFRTTLLDARASVEDRYRVEIEQVIRDDAPMTPRLVAVIEAAREAMVNAARHSGSPGIDLFAEVTSKGVQVNIRDRGVGFDKASIGTGGLAHSVIKRVEEVGGTASVRTRPGAGTEIELFLPADV
jgi:signal transduction histidine kinase